MGHGPDPGQLRNVRLAVGRPVVVLVVRVVLLIGLAAVVLIIGMATGMAIGSGRESAVVGQLTNAAGRVLGAMRSDAVPRVSGPGDQMAIGTVLAGAAMTRVDLTDRDVAVQPAVPAGGQRATAVLSGPVAAA